jgi:adenylate cyclase
VSEGEAGDRPLGRAGAMRSLFDLAVATEDRFTLEEVAAEIGVDAGFLRRLWRALGFAESEPGARVCSAPELEALREGAFLLRNELVPEELVLQTARVMGYAVSRMAGAQAGVLESIVQRPLAEADEEEANAAIDTLDRLVPLLEAGLLNAWRRHFVVAMARGSGGSAGAAAREAAIGFADLVGFTAMSEDVEPMELERTLDEFEELGLEVVGDHGGRVVKTIGDEVMFVVDHADDAVDGAIALLEACDASRSLPELRVGVAYGRLVAFAGDYFGPTVNLASRLVAAAEPNTVLVSDSARAALVDRRLPWTALRWFSLKGLGVVPAWEVDPIQPWWLPRGALRRMRLLRSPGGPHRWFIPGR